MSQTLYTYRPRGAGLEDERTLHRWFPTEGAPATIRGDDGLSWDLRPARPRDTKRAVKCIREGIRSLQAPKWWPYAKRHDKTGACIFENETEYKEAIKRAADAGEPVAWDN